ncbi:MAG: UDP-N-acetylmuramate--L-alanine ligase, partial [Clostridia bacterium]|nr:UDP-N-acetylmuramate--L-alanine ligase [Clostridia bacterium]
RFADLVPADGGVTAAFGDDGSIREFLQGVEKKIVYFGFHAENDYIAANLTEELGYYSFDVVHHGEILCRVRLAVPGKHAVIDAMAAFTVSVAYGVDPEVAARALENFHGAKRRFEKVGTFKGIQVVDDFAHHPGELKTTLDAARRMGYERVICLFQPHTYTRTEALYKDFARELSAADVTILAPIYPAREENIHNISSALIGNEMESCLLPASMEEAEEWIRREAREGDLILTVGAGDIFKVAYSLIKD